MLSGARLKSIRFTHTVMDEPDANLETPQTSEHSDELSTPDNFCEESDGLRMSREAMLELARRAAELLVERIERLPGEHAWDGEFRQDLVDQLLEDPPESGQPALPVIERAARDILPLAVRNDHPRFFGFIPSSPTWPSVVADFMAAGFHVNQCTWLTSSGASQLELVVIDWFRPLGRLSRDRGRAADQRGLGGQPRCLRGGARSRGTP